jgi:parallel beta helix pectate lyase-like protein
MMTKSAVAGLVLFLVLVSGSAGWAQPFGRTFVSAQRGDDLNDCLPTTPCRTFAKALINTAANGEIIVLDSGGYGTAVIDKAVQITAPAGVYAGMSAASGNAITINATNFDSVVLRGLTLNSTGAADGIRVNAVGSLHVENLTATGFTFSGIHFGVAGELYVKDSVFRRNVFAIDLGTPTGTVRASVDHAAFEKNSAGIIARANAKATANNSVATRNESGFISAGTAAELTLEKCVATHNTLTGAHAHSSGTMRVSNSTVTNNFAGFRNEGGGTFLSRENNTVEGNAFDIVGTIGTYTAQ